ncbi:hypothetical protein [Nonomuraea coxensis]|uniref:hypothetical protein n=1 Tax=Nonomuraea coxensis TaxID=404386 RepID=UPI000368B6F3|nr:hypothetical protein [Nonomuraea coxensis]
MPDAEDPPPDDAPAPPDAPPALPRAGPPTPRTPPSASGGRRRGADQVLSILGCVCAAVAVLYAPVLFGLAGIVLGVAGHLRGEPLGRWAAVAAGAGMVAGTALTLVLQSVMS